jgi:hypothetical protein
MSMMEGPFGYIVSSSTGCSDLQYFEELYRYCTTEKVRYSVQSKWVLTFYFWYRYICEAYKM